MSHTEGMDRDPDFIEPQILRDRAAATGGAGVEQSRPEIRRTAGEASPQAGFAIEESTLHVRGLRIAANGLHVREGAPTTVNR